MLKFADLLDQNVAELAKLETIAMGQPIGVSTVSWILDVPGTRLNYSDSYHHIIVP
jgi:hypothetical protein